MASGRPPKTSQGTDMMELLRFPDAILYEKILKICNISAKPIANRTVCNKCYILLWKATCFSSSVFIGIQNVLVTLDKMIRDPVPCLVMLAADAFIDAEMLRIVEICKNRLIPYIFLPTKKGMKDALNVENDVLALCIAFNRDPGMRREFEDCFLGIKSQCFKKRKRKRYDHRNLPSTSTSTRPEVGPGGEMPQQAGQSDLASSVAVISLLDDPENSESDWITLTSGSESSEDERHQPQRAKLKDFSVNVPDESGSSFREFVRIPSPTPALSPSKMAAQQRQETESSSMGEASTACSSDESVVPGPSRQFLTPPMRRRHRSPYKQPTWPVSLPLASQEGLEDQKIRLYLQSLCSKKKRIRSRVSAPSCSIQQNTTPPQPQPSTSRLPDPTVPPEPQEEPIVIDNDDDDELTFQWTMDDLPSTSNEQLIDLIGSSGDEVQEISSSDEDEAMSTASSATTVELTIDDGAHASRCNAYPSAPSAVEEHASSTSSDSDMDVESPRSPSPGLENVQVSSLSAFSETPSEASITGEYSAPHPTPIGSGMLDELRAVSSSSGAVGNVSNASAGMSSSGLSAPGGLGDVPEAPVYSGALGDSASVSRADDIDGAIHPVGVQHPSAFGDVGLGDGFVRSANSNRRNLRRYTVSGRDEDAQQPFMLDFWILLFAPPISSNSTENGNRVGWNNPREAAPESADANPTDNGAGDSNESDSPVEDMPPTPPEE